MKKRGLQQEELIKQVASLSVNIPLCGVVKLEALSAFGRD